MKKWIITTLLAALILACSKTETTVPVARSSVKTITSFIFGRLTPTASGVVDEATKKIAVQVPVGTAVTALVPTITIADNATVSPASGVAANFSNPVNYTVTAEDGSTITYVVTVTVATSTTTTPTSTTGLVPPLFTTGNGNTAQLVEAANAFLATLDATLKAKTVYAFTSTQKSVWSNFPISDVARNGIRTGDMSATQRAAAYALMAMLLSQKGYENMAATILADQYLVDTTKPSWTGGTANYTIAIFGTPSTTDAWMIQFNGHHTALNATIKGSNMVLTPSLTGAQPMTFTLNGTAYKPWGNQTTKGFAFVNALTASQQAKAVLGYTVNDLVLGPGNDAKTIVPEGIKGSDLTAAQQTQLLDLASEWVNTMNDAGATPKLAELKANIADTYFAWSGPLTAGSVVYYRIQGPTVVIEYSCQQKNADHVHAMYRDPTNDYGKKL